MCNAWNHSAGCTCGWGGEGHLGSSSGGNFGYYAAPAPVRSWDLERDTEVLTRPTSCWWCGAAVYFHRSETGGCVLFDDLGPPWPVHSCWDLRADQRGTGLEIMALQFDRLSYDGCFYRTEVRRHAKPERTAASIAVQGYVSNNRLLYVPAQRHYLPASSGAQAGAIAVVEVMSSDQTMYPFRLPESVALLIDDFDVVTMRGRWRKRRGRWLLLATHITIWTVGEGEGTTWEWRPDVSVLSCHLCCVQLLEKDPWGIDEQYAVECGVCGSARGRLSSDDFISLCRRIVRSERRKARRVADSPS